MNQKTNFLQKTYVVCIGALICCALWGSAFPCIKLGCEWMSIDATDVSTQILYAGVRFTLAGIFTIILGSILGRHILIPKKKSMPKILWLSLFQTVLQYLFFYVGLANTTGVKASIIEGMNVFVAIAIAGFIFKMEAVTSRKIIGCFIGLIGVVLVNISGTGLDVSFSILGEGFIFLSTVAYAFSSVYMKRFSKTEQPVMLSGYQFVVGGIVMSVCGLCFGGHLDKFSTKAILMLLWLATVSALAYSLWSILLKHNPVSKVAVFGFMNPVFGVFLSAILLDEKDSLGFTAIIAMLLVCTGIYIVNSNRASS